MSHNKRKSTNIMIKKIELNNTKNEKIKGVLKEKNTSGPLLIVGHGFNSSKEHPATDEITDKLYKMGHSTFSFDFSKSAQAFSLREQVSDILDIINYFSNYKETILLAPSIGALSMVIATTQSERVKGIVTVNGFFGTAQLGKEILKTYLLFRLLVLFKREYKDTWNYFNKNYKPEKIRCNTLIIHAKHDEVVFISQSQGFYKKVKGKKELYILENADHHLTREEYKQETAEEIDKWLMNRN